MFWKSKKRKQEDFDKKCDLLSQELSALNKAYEHLYYNLAYHEKLGGLFIFVQFILNKDNLNFYIQYFEPSKYNDIIKEGRKINHDDLSYFAPFSMYNTGEFRNLVLVENLLKESRKNYKKLKKDFHELGIEIKNPKDL